jgi:hypothetical protein
MTHRKPGEAGLIEEPRGVAGAADRVDECERGTETVEEGFVVGDNDVGCTVAGAHTGSERATIPRRGVVVRPAHDG